MKVIHEFKKINKKGGKMIDAYFHQVTAGPHTVRTVEC